MFPERAAGIAGEGRASSPIRTKSIRRAPDIILGSWCGKKFRPEKVAARPGWSAIPAVRDGELHEIKSPIILQPGPAALTDGVREIAAIVLLGRHDSCRSAPGRDLRIERIALPKRCPDTVAPGALGKNSRLNCSVAGAAPSRSIARSKRSVSGGDDPHAADVVDAMPPAARSRAARSRAGACRAGRWRVPRDAARAGRFPRHPVPAHATSSSTVRDRASMPYCAATASSSTAVCIALARMVMSPTCRHGGVPGAAAVVAGGCGRSAAAAADQRTTRTWPSADHRTMRNRGSVIGRRQLRGRARWRARIAPRDQVAEAAGLEGFDRGLGGAVRRGDATAQLRPALRPIRSACAPRRARSAAPACAPHRRAGLRPLRRPVPSLRRAGRRRPGPLPDTAVTASILASSSIHTVRPTRGQQRLGARRGQRHRPARWRTAR